MYQKVQVGNDQEKVYSGREPLSKNRDGKIMHLYQQNIS